jgi:hypothetical protein
LHRHRPGITQAQASGAAERGGHAAPHSHIAHVAHAAHAARNHTAVVAHHYALLAEQSEGTRAEALLALALELEELGTEPDVGLRLGTRMAHHGERLVHGKVVGDHEVGDDDGDGRGAPVSAVDEDARPFLARAVDKVDRGGDVSRNVRVGKVLRE